MITVELLRRYRALGGPMYHPGERIAVTEGEADRLVTEGVAIPLQAPPPRPPEKAVPRPPVHRMVTTKPGPKAPVTKEMSGEA